MALSSPRTVFGIHEFTPYNRSDGLPYGTLRVLGNSSLDLSGELVTLNGGSNRYPWDVQDGNITAEISLTLREYPDFLFELFLGKAPTTTTDDTDGTVSSLENKSGTSVADGTTGIASVGIESGEEGDLKFGKYVVKAVSATTVDVYCLSDVDFQRGTDIDFEDDNLKITASALTIATDTAVSVPNTGIELTGGTGTIAMTVGETAIYEVRPPYSKSMEVNIGATTDVFPEFGALMVAEQKGSGEMLDIEAYRCKAIGLPIGLQEKSFSEAEITAQAFYDSSLNRVLRIRHVQPS